jgi:DTW domain-containing protein
MTNRGKNAPRCARCFMLEGLCVCADIPSLKSRTELVVILSSSEAKKPTNTGRLAALAISPSRVLVRGLPDAPLDLAFLDPARTVVLCPDEEATSLDVFRFEGALTLVVPDGSWRQASKMPRREPLLRDLPRVKLPLLPHEALRARAETKDNGMSTLGAIAHAYAHLESPDVGDALLRFHALVIARILRGRGAA